MSKQTINIGASPNDGTGTPLRTSFDYTNQNFTELYTALGGGVGLPGATTQVIFNDGGTNLAGDAGLVYNKTTDALTVAGLVTAGSATITGAATVGTTLAVTGNLTAAADSILGTGSKATDTLLDFKADTGTQRIYLDRGGRNLIFKDVTTNIENYRITGVTGVHTWGVGGSTAMTLNSTGLGIGQIPISNAGIIQVGRANNTGFSDIGTFGYSVGETYQWVIGPSTQANNNGNSKMWRMRVDKPASAASGSSFSIGTWAGYDASVNGNYVPSSGWLDRLIIDSSGNVGIGVTPSAWRTSVPFKALQIGYTGAVYALGATEQVNLSSNYLQDTGGNEVRIQAGYATRYQQSSGQHLWSTAASSTAGSGITFTPAMTLDTSGNLLVASGVVRAAGRTEIGSGYIGDISGTGNNSGIFFGSTGLLPANGSGTTSDNTNDLGSATARWDTVFAGTGTINTSDRNEKQDIIDLSASEKRVASSIKQLVKKYRFKDAVASKGENTRIHVGWIAQDIQSAFAAEGLDASNYGMFCSDTWEENGVEKTRLGLRYDEVLAFVVSTI